MQFVPSNNVTYTYGNAYADMITGNISQYQETSFNRVNDISYTTYEGFIQDSWKVTPRLTLDLGVRLTHFDPWVDRLGYGYSIFDASKYGGASCAGAPNFCGFLWHARDASVPVGGFPTRTLFWQPRFGFAYDLFGKGKTVIRGGWGQFYFHSGQFTSGLDASAGVSSVTVTPGNIGGRLLARNLSTLPVSATPSAPVATDSRDDRQPLTQSWSLTVSQRTPWSGQLEAAYVGNRSRNLQLTSGALSNINMVAPGAMLGLVNPALGNANSFRPYQGYGDINIATNGLYSNYNALQLTWARRSGRYTMQLNYSFQKAMGIVSSTIDPFNLRNDYGVQPGNRTHLFNATYSAELGSPIKNNFLAKGLVNGWQVSGVVQLQSGANLTYNSGSGIGSGSNFNMQLNNAIIPGTQGVVNPSGTNGIGINNQSIYGTNAMTLLPVLTCDPRKNLAEHQFINGSCFAAPTTPGQSIPLLPAIYGPAFFNADLGLFKNFNLGEQRKLQFRFEAYNFLNHPLWSFPTGTNLLTLQFQQAANGGAITQTNSNFGKTLFKQGNRVVEMAVKFYF
jgi:hypothetical protein